MTLKQLTGSTADTYREYIQRNLPEGVSMKVKISSNQRQRLLIKLYYCVLQVIKHEVRRLLPEVSEQPGKQHDN